MPEPKRPLKVFLSYASQDKPLVRELSRRLVGEGWIETWQDEKNLLPGQDWRVKIEEAVEEADVVIIVLSQHSVSKEGHVQKELRYAREIALEKPEESIFLIPLRLDECEVPRGLRFYQWVDYFGERKNDGYASLVESLQLRYEQKLKQEEASARQEKIRKEREAAEKIVRENAEKEAAEKARLEARELAKQKAAKETEEREVARKQAEKETAEKVRLKEEEQARQKAAKEKVERDAAEKSAREKVEKETSENAKREKAERESVGKTKFESVESKSRQKTTTSGETLSKSAFGHKGLVTIITVFIFILIILVTRSLMNSPRGNYATTPTLLPTSSAPVSDLSTYSVTIRYIPNVVPSNRVDDLVLKLQKLGYFVQVDSNISVEGGWVENGIYYGDPNCLYAIENIKANISDVANVTTLNPVRFITEDLMYTARNIVIVFVDSSLFTQ